MLTQSVEVDRAVAALLGSRVRCEMSFLPAAPEALVTAASDLAGLGSTISTANAVAAAPTTGVLAAATDEVSTQSAALFSEHALGYQQLSAQAAAFHEQFVRALSASASTYAAAEANTVQTLVKVNAPARAVLGHPLIAAPPQRRAVVALRPSAPCLMP